MYPEEVVWRMVVTGTLISLLFVIFMAAVLLALRSRLNRKNKEYVQALVHEKERTMYTISVEIHDNIMQQLYLSKTKLYLLHDQVAGNNKAEVADILTILERVMADSGMISHSLNNDYLRKKRLLPALTEDVARINSSRELACRLVVTGDARPIPAGSELMIYRIAQEAIRNAMKHGRAKALVISICYDEDNFSMTVMDNGIGFDYNNPLLNGGIGLASMDQRARLLKGSLKIRTAPGAGCSVILLLPGIGKNNSRKRNLLPS